MPAFLTPIDLTQNELQNAVLQNLGTAPGSPKLGQFYFNSTSNAGYIWNGTVWMPTDATKLVGVIPLTALATDPLARANHTGTQLAATISNLASTVQGYTLDQFAAPAANINMNGKTLTGLPAPAAAGQAVEYSWVLGQIQAASAGIDSKPSCRAASNVNITLSGTQTIDTVVLVAGDRILCLGQTDATQNGPYIVSAGAWARASDTITPQAFWMIEEGHDFGGSQWKCATTGTIVIGTTPITINQWGQGQVYTAGNGLQLSGNTFSIKLPANSGLVSDSTGLYVDTSIVARKKAFTIGDGSTTSFVLTHNLGSQDIHVTVRRVSDNQQVYPDNNATSTNTATIIFGTGNVPSTNQYRVFITG